MKKKNQEPTVSFVLTDISKIFLENFTEYGYHTIKNRAVPSLEDGMKPIHRRILYSMYINKYPSNGIYKKSAKMVGEVMGNFHPHGDSSVYEASVLLAQDFSNNNVLIDGHGSFGTIDDPKGYSASRYSEQRLDKFSEDVLLDGLSKHSVTFVPNYDGTTEEPTILPAKIPLVLLNGIEGIATGFATSIPPHNLGEIIDACTAYINNRNITKTELLKIIPAPDYPTGGIINGTGGMPLMYNSGNGGLKLRGKIESTQNKKGEWEVVVTEVPFKIKPDDILKQVVLLNELGVIKVQEAINSADRNHKVRLFFRFHKSEQDIKRIESILYSRTNLESKFHYNFLVLDKGVPKKLSLLEIIRKFVSFREEVLYRTHFNEYEKNEARLHILDGLFKAIPVIDDIIHIIRKSENVEEAATRIIKKFSLSQLQTDYILRLPIMRLTKLDMNTYKEEHKKLTDRNKELQILLKNNGSNEHIDKLMKSEWEAIKKKYAKPRKTIIKNKTEAIDTTLIIKSEPCMIITTKKGYMKRLPLTQADMVQGRGGKGRNIPGIDLDDEVKDIIDCDTTTELTLVTSTGKVYNKLAYEIDETNGVGKLISTVFDLNKKDKPVLFTAFSDNIKNVFLVTNIGNVKVSKITDLRGNIKVDPDKKSRSKKGNKLMKLENLNEYIVGAVGLTMTSNDSEAIISTSNGKALRLNVADIRVSSSSAGGIKGITLTGDDYVTSACGVNSEFITVVSSTGFAKRIETSSIRMTSRGGKGVIISSSSDEGNIIYITDKEEGLLTVTTSTNKMLTFELNSLRVTGKTSKGVKIVSLTKDEYITRVF